LGTRTKYAKDGKEVQKLKKSNGPSTKNAGKLEVGIKCFCSPLVWEVRSRG